MHSIVIQEWNYNSKFQLMKNTAKTCHTSIDKVWESSLLWSNLFNNSLSQFCHFTVTTCQQRYYILSLCCDHLSIEILYPITLLWPLINKNIISNVLQEKCIRLTFQRNQKTVGKKPIHWNENEKLKIDQHSLMKTSI